MSVGACRHAENIPVRTVAARDHPDSPAQSFGQDRTREIVLVPARRNEDDPAAGHEPGLDVVLVGFARARADQIRAGFVAALDRIVDDDAVGAIAGDAGENAGRHILGAIGERPFVGGQDSELGLVSKIAR